MTSISSLCLRLIKLYGGCKIITLLSQLSGDISVYWKNSVPTTKHGDFDYGVISLTNRQSGFQIDLIDLNEVLCS